MCVRGHAYSEITSVGRYCLYRVVKPCFFAITYADTYTHKQMNLTEASGLKILGKHSVACRDSNYQDAIEIMCVFGPDMQYIVCVCKLYLVYTVDVHR